MTASRTRQLPQRPRRLAQRDHLGVGGGVRAQLALVVARADDLAVVDDHGPDRNVVVLGRALGLAQGEAHEVLVTGEEVAAQRRTGEPHQGNFRVAIMS